MKRCKWGWLLALTIAVMLLGFGTVLAAWNIKGHTVNFLTMSSYKNSIEEEYKIPDHVEPGQKVVKKVTVINEGNVDTFVRVKVSRTFGIKGEAEEFLEDGSLDPEMIEIDYNRDYWKLLEDGYWYYTDVLRAGKRTKEPLMKSYRLSEKADNRYKKKEAQIIINMESIQAAEGIMEELWGIREKDLGIIYQPCTCETESEVIIQKDRNIIFQGEEDNLFSGFQNLLPGCTRTQNIRVVNKSEERMELLLHAEGVKQNKMTEEQKELVKELLSKYAVIQIKEGNTVLYQGTVDGNLSGKGWSMQNDISLGTFRPDEGKKLAVSLSLDPQMDNRYQKLTGKVKWVFTAEEAEEKSRNQESSYEKEKWSSASEKTVGVISPKTGDDTDAFPEIFLLIIGVTGAVFSFRKIYGEKRAR